jgi:signal transduction histidine kinase
VRVQPEGPGEVADVGASLNALAEALEHSEQRQREFLMSVSHELRTPLTAIRGFGEALADGMVDGDAVPAAGRTIVGEARRLDRLVADLLDLGRLGADDFRYDLAPVDLDALVGEAGQAWQRRCAAVGVRFGLERPSRPVVVSTDAARVRQVVDGLAENALRVTPAGAPLVLALRTAGGEAVIVVRDGGRGLTAEDREVAFERSALHDRYRGLRPVGTGLGLALVKALATGLGGRVEADVAAREGGACFRVRLPLPMTTPAHGGQYG